MKNYIGIILLFFIACQTSDGVNKDELKEGDIIFQNLETSQSKAIELATHSKYTHVGIIFKKENDFFVYEAICPVKFTPLDEWISNGKDNHYVIKRLKNSGTILIQETIEKMKSIGKKYDGKNYDAYFGWSDERIYCSELVWKIYYEATGLEIGKLQALKEFDLSSEILQEKLEERYGNHVPLEEQVISPAAMFNSELLMSVKED